MFVQPINGVATQSIEVRPFLDCQRKLEMSGTGVRYSHEYTPKDHVDTGIQQKQKTYV
jgi:hypothetical protein